MMARSRKSKILVAVVLMMTLVSTYCMPVSVFAEDNLQPKPEWKDYANKEQTEISSTITNNVKEAEKQADVAEDAAEDAADAAKTAAEEVKKAETAASDADTKADSAKTNATSAEAIHTEGAKYVEATEQAIKTDVDTATGIIQGKADVAKDAAAAATDAAKAAAAAAAAAKAATSSADAEKAAKAAADAAKIAETKAGVANQAYLDAEKTLTAAKAAYDQAVQDANKEIDQYNNKVDSYVKTVENFDLKLLREAYDEAEKAAKDAEKAAESAGLTADKAAVAAAVAADAAVNFDVDPAKLAYDKAVADKAAADAAKLAADKVVGEKQTVESQKKSAYDNIVPSTTASARATQDGIVAQKNAEKVAAEAAFNKQNNWEKFWDEKLNREEYKKMKDAEAAYNNANSDSAYNNAVIKALQSTSEYQAWTASQSDAAKALAEAAAKNLEVANAQSNVIKNEAALNSAKKTRDDYLKEIIAAVGEEDAAKIIEALNKEVDGSETDVNQAIYDAGLYDWANKTKLQTVIYLIYLFDYQPEKALYWDAASTVGDINKVYTRDGFVQWLDKMLPEIHNYIDTDSIIKDAEAAYRKELKLHEEALATNQAYLAKIEAAKAAEEAAAKQKAAADATAKLAAASSKLANAEATLKAAKEQVAKLEKLKLDTANAQAALNNAQGLVDKAKEAKDIAKKAADQAKLDETAAQKAVNNLKLKETVKFFVLIKGVRPTVEGSQSTAKYTSKLATLTITNPGITLGTGKSMVNEFATATKYDVENKIVGLSSQASYDSLVSQVRTSIQTNYSQYLGQGSNWNIDWYDLKWENDGWHVDGNIVIDKPDIPAPNNEVGFYSVRYLVTGSSIEVANSTKGTTTASSITITSPSLSSGYTSYKAVGIVGGSLNADGSVIIKYDDIPYGEHVATVWFQQSTEVPQTPEKPSNPASDTGRSSRSHSNTVTIADAEIPAGPIVTLAAITPLAEITTAAAITPVEQYTIPNEKLPAGKLPKTGGVPSLLLYAIGAMLAGGGAALRLREKKANKAN